MSENAVELSKVCKHYQLFDRPQQRLLQMISRGRYSSGKIFHALSDVEFVVPRGTTLGLIGRNGAGKSTLLQIISGIVTPTSGTAVVHGRVAALLELGTGFNPEFSGRENIFLNAAVLGLSNKEIEAKLADIISFADIGEFIEHPVKTYSSGMYIRLAFAIAINADPEILIVDEALAVGDARFQAKCFRKFEELQSSGKTIILVTHSTEQVVRHCDRAILLENGRVLADGVPRDVCNQYLDLLFGTNSKRNGARKLASNAQVAITSAASLDIPPDAHAALTSNGSITTHPGYNPSEYRWGSRGAEIEDCFITSGEQHRVNSIEAHLPFELYMRVRFNTTALQPVYGLTIKSPDGVVIYGTNSRDAEPGRELRARQNDESVIVAFKGIPRLVPGTYLISLGVADVSEGDDPSPLDRRYDVIELIILNSSRAYGLVDLGFHVTEYDLATDSRSPERASLQTR